MIDIKYRGDIMRNLCCFPRCCKCNPTLICRGPTGQTEQNIELCVCYSNIKDYGLSKYHNQMAGKIKPDSNAVKYNEEFFNIKYCLRFFIKCIASF